jgi:hypothetical protein
MLLEMSPMAVSPPTGSAYARRNIMPVGRKLTKAEKDRIAALPRDPETILQGTLRPAEVGIESADLGPSLTLWLDGDGQIRASQIVETESDYDDQVRRALETVVTALIGREDDRDLPDFAPQPLRALPARIETDIPELLRPLRAMLGPYAIPIELVEELPVVDTAVQEMSEFLAGVSETPPRPFEWEVAPDLLSPLYRAAKALRAQGRRMQIPNNPPVMVALGAHGPSPDVEALLAEVLSADDELDGITFYFSAEDMRRALETDEAVDEADEQVLSQDIEALMGNIERMAGDRQIGPRDLGRLLGQALTSMSEAEGESPDALVLYFDDREDASRSYLEWLDKQKVGPLPRDVVPTFGRLSREGEPRPPNEREVRAMTLAMSALEQFFAHVPEAAEATIATQKHAGQTVEVADGDRTVAITVTYPPPADVWPEQYSRIGEPAIEPMEPPSASGPTTLYRFQVRFDDADPPIWRRMELRGDQTLHDLHEGIQEAFAWDDDHLYAFFLSRKAWDESTEYSSPSAESGENAASHRLEHLPLKPKQKFLYIFDFGDELRHTITLEAVVPGGVEQGAEYPRMTERQGENVPQYPNEEDYLEDDGELLDDEDEGEDE